MKIHNLPQDIKTTEKIRNNGSDVPMIQMRNVYKTFISDAGEFVALNGIDIDFNQGDFIGITGKSGSGKSTLANMITGIDHPTSGEVIIGDVNVHKMNESQMARWRGKNLGIVFQFYQLLPMLTLLENVMLPMDFGDVYNPVQREKHATELLRLVGLAEHAHKMPSAVSGGQQQTAAIARALANDPPIIIADEPTGNLDSRTAENVFQVFEDLARRGKTIIMVTHDPGLAKRTSRQIVLSDGEIINEWVNLALPLLSHTQMLKASHNIVHQVYEPGETIVRQDVENEMFHIISKGMVDVAVENSNGGDIVVTSLEAGNYFGEIELLQNRQAIATIRANQREPVETMALPQRIFSEIISEATAMRNALLRVVQTRLSENLFARKQNLHKRTDGVLIA